MGNGCGSVSKAVTSESRDPRIESSHRQTFNKEHLFPLHQKTKVNKKEAWNGPLENIISPSACSDQAYKGSKIVILVHTKDNFPVN